MTASTPRLAPRRLARRRRGLRPPRLGGLTINKMLPNMLTVMALSSGMTGIRFAIEQHWHRSVLAILVAAVFDALDGRIARLLNGQSKFGEELDSLSDVVSFGVAPAMILYLWSLQHAPSYGWIACLMFGACAALRLARFNTGLGLAGARPLWAYNYFTGVPAPAGAALALLPLIASFELGPEWMGHPGVVAVWTVGMAALMISAVPTFSLKGIHIPQRFAVFVLLGLALLVGAIVNAPWLTLMGMGFAYLVSIPFSVRQYHRLRVQAEGLVADEPAAPTDGVTGGEGGAPA